MILYRFMSNEEVDAEGRSEAKVFFAGVQAPAETIRLNRPVLQFADDGHAMPHVRFGQRWALPDGLEVAVLDVVTPRFIGRREDGVRVVGECSDLHEHGKLVVDVPPRSEREMIANTVYREAEFPPDGMTKKAWLAQMVRHTESRPGFRARTHWEFCADAIGCQLSSWRGALELTWPAPVVSPVEPVKAEPVAERPAVRVGQVWRYKNSNIDWTVCREERPGFWAVDAPNDPYVPISGETDFLEDGWQLIRDVEAPRPALSRKVEVGQVWRLLGQEAKVYAVEPECAGVVFDGCTYGTVVDLYMGEPLESAWERVS